MTILIDINRRSRCKRSDSSSNRSTTTWRCALGMSMSMVAVLILQATPSFSFQQQQRFSVLPTTPNTKSMTGNHQNLFRLLGSSLSLSSSSDDNNNDDKIVPTPYVPIRESTPLSTKKQALVPKVGDVVRYYDLDGGEARGQVLVGKISYVFGSKAYGGYSVELYELEDVGDGYFAEYASALRSRKGRKTERRLEEVSPIAASFVGSEQAYKVPIDSQTKLPKPRQETYDIDEYEGPSFYASVDTNVLEQDAENYEALKSKLFRNVLLTGLVGTIVTNASYGIELAVIYFAGSVASLLYLFLLSVKTDTVAVNSEDNTKNLAGTPIANLRFGAPILVLVGVSIWNSQKMSSGLGDDGFTVELFDTVSREQFGAAVLGFLTYRLPLFVGQIRDAFKNLEAENNAEGGKAAMDSGVQLPGSAGVAAKLLSRGKKSGDDTENLSDGEASDLVSILLVSGPQATGRQELIQRLLTENNGDDDDLSRLVAPKRVVRMDDGATYERLERRNEFLETDALETSGLTTDGILDAARGLSQDGVTEIPNKNVVVVDASVELAQKLTTANLRGNTRLICVWVGLTTVKDFEARLEEDIAKGALKIPEDESKESFLRGKIKSIINEIDFGLGSGVFEFTILNDFADPDKSLKELKEAASYCFK